MAEETRRAAESATENVVARFRRVLAYVETRLDEPLTVERLSGVAAYSKFHFHRQFTALFGVGVSEYVRLLRLKRAAYRLAFRDGTRILDVALECGYESHEAFARAFKQVFGRTPSEFRGRPRWDAWYATYRDVSETRRAHMTTEHRIEDVSIVDFPETRVAALEHRGDPSRVGETVRAFIAWRKASGLSPRTSATFNVFYEDPSSVPPEAFLLDLCAATDRPVAENPEGVVAKTIPGGRCAVLRHVGSEDTLPESIGFLYRTWLPQSGEEPRDFPLFLRRVRFFPDVPEHEAVVDVFLPIA